MFISPIWANLALTHANTHKQHRTCFGIGEDSPCLGQRTENRVRKKHVFASVCSEVMKEWGGVGMLKFLVLLPLHVATLHRCLVVLHLCIHSRNGPQCWKVDTWVASACVRRSWRGGVGGGHVKVPCTSSATCCYAAQMSGSVASVYTLSKWSAVLEGWHIWVASACVRRSWMSGVGGEC